MQSVSRRALLIVDLQKEFLDPHTGRCLLPSSSADVTKQPGFLSNIKDLLPRFRELGGDVIWARSESKARRDFTDPRVEETIFIVNDDSDSDSVDENQKSRRAGKIRRGFSNKTKGRVAGADGKGPSRPPLLTDAFLSIDTNFPPVAPDTAASEWHEPVRDMIASPADRIITKSWYSAFKDTPLLQILRGRIVTQLCIVGLMTNVGILATAADATRHGLEVSVLTDCLGHRHEQAHKDALQIMEEDFMVDLTDSVTFIVKWDGSRASGSLAGVGVGAAGMTPDEISKMLEGIKLPTASGTPEKTEKGAASGPSARKGKPRSPKKSTKPIIATSTSSPTKSDSAGAFAMMETTENKKADSIPQTKSKHKDARKYESKAPVLGEGDKLGEGDSYIVNHILPSDLADASFERLKKEVAWRSMFHRGGEVPRLVAVEGEIQDDGSFPVYRHPADESPPLMPFSSTVSLIRDEAQKVLKHPINHVLIQHYRTGHDYISEHSDKTLDIARGSKIVNVSLGAQRVMLLRTKKDLQQQTLKDGDHAALELPNDESGARRDMQRIPMPHNSMFVLGLQTNKKWLHGIKQDKRETKFRSSPELAYNGERISLTFRHIATYLSSDEKTIYGQGAKAKASENAEDVVNGDSESTQRLLEAFGVENHQSEFDWDKYYGPGFNVLHFQEPMPKILTPSEMDIPTARIKICLREKGVKFAEQVIQENQLASLRTLSVRGQTPVYIDADRERTTISDSLAALLYLEMLYPPAAEDGLWLLPSSREQRAKYGLALNRLQEANRLLEVSERGIQDEIDQELRLWNTCFQRSRYAAGDEYSLADIALYPVLEMLRRGARWTNECFPDIATFMQTLECRKSVQSVYGCGGDEIVELERALEAVTIKDAPHEERS